MMRRDTIRNTASAVTGWGIITGITVGLVTGFLAGLQPLMLGAVMLTLAILFSFLTYFEQTVLGLLILRSALDIFSVFQIPALFAIGLDGLTLLYVTVLILTHQDIPTDWFWWFFLGWVGFQGFWIVLLSIGALGLDKSFLVESVGEWIRLFSWLMTYLLVSQLRGKIAPQRVINLLFLALILPLSIAVLQLLIPANLPAILSPRGVHSANLIGDVFRIRGTLGHSNTFTTILLFFISLTIWQLGQSKKRIWWLCLLAVLAFFFVSTKALFGLMMLATFTLVLLVPKLNLWKLIAGIFFVALIVGIFASSEFGQARLASLSRTPLFNPDLTVDKAILLSQGDYNSFNWRLAQWTYLLKQWTHFPIFGYGLGLSLHVSDNQLYPHNDYVRALVEGGIVGFMSLMAFFGFQFIRLIEIFRNSHGKQQNLSLVMLAFLASLLVGMITENIWTHTTLFFYWWTLLAVVGWDWERSLKH